MKRNIIGLLLIVAMNIPVTVLGAGVDDYLILKDIGLLKLSKLHKSLPGEPPIGGPRSYEGGGVAGHFPDHIDMTYEVDYFDFTDVYPSPTVYVTQHTGGDTDSKWLLHELEGSYRNSNQPEKFRGMVRTVGASKIITYFKGTRYTWLSNGVLVNISYYDPTLTKPEPTEILTAYLQKYPSTLPAITFDKAHDKQWLKKEIDRRLWLADKYLATIQPEDPKLHDKLDDMVQNMLVFLDYREKYYGVKAADEKTLLEEYLYDDKQASLIDRLTDYKTWWEANKSVEIALP